MQIFQTKSILLNTHYLLAILFLQDDIPLGTKAVEPGDKSSEPQVVADNDGILDGMEF